MILINYCCIIVQCYVQYNYGGDIYDSNKLFDC